MLFGSRRKNCKGFKRDSERKEERGKRREEGEMKKKKNSERISCKYEERPANVGM